MGTFKANVGNLMQHWTFCETLGAIEETSQRPDLFFLCTHSMAPGSQPGPRNSNPVLHQHFDRVLQRTFGGNADGCAYAQAWRALSGPAGLPYPSSAAFAVNRWRGGLSLWLCENSAPVAAEISNWWNRDDFPRNLLGRRIHERGWQACFQRPQQGRQQEERELLVERASQCKIAFIECDPDMVITQEGTRRDNPRIIYYEDVFTIAQLATELDIPVVIQISSYSTQFNNPPEQVRDVVSRVMDENGFALRASVAVENTMTSLIYSNGPTLWNDAPEHLSASFNDWLRAK